MSSTPRFVTRFPGMIEQFRTDRLIIRRFSPADLDGFCAYQADPRVRRYVPGDPMDVGADQLIVEA